jgi:hypothetical protein
MDIIYKTNAYPKRRGHTVLGPEKNRHVKPAERPKGRS